MAEKHDPKAINKKLRNLSKDQANALAGVLNENYIKKPAAKKTTPKKSGK